MGISHINVHIIQTLLGKFQKKKSHFGQKGPHITIKVRRENDKEIV